MYVVDSYTANWSKLAIDNINLISARLIFIFSWQLQPLKSSN